MGGQAELSSLPISGSTMAGYPYQQAGTITRKAVMTSLVRVVPAAIILFSLGHYFDEKNKAKLDFYHNKSSLFGGKDLKPGERLWKLRTTDQLFLNKCYGH